MAELASSTAADHLVCTLTKPAADSGDPGCQVRLMEDRGYQLGNLDATIIAQKPKLSPFKEQIRNNLASLLGAHPSVINLKVSGPLLDLFPMHARNMGFGSTPKGLRVRMLKYYRVA